MRNLLSWRNRIRVVPCVIVLLVVVLSYSISLQPAEWLAQALQVLLYCVHLVLVGSERLLPSPQVLGHVLHSRVDPL